MNSTLESNEFICEHKRSDMDFTRKSLLNFKNLFHFLTNIRTSSNQTELNNYFKDLNNEVIASSPLTGEAVCIARKKILPTAFSAMNKLVCDEFYRIAEVKLWHGHRLFAVDGSTLELPEVPELVTHFGREKDNFHRTPILARISQIYDLLNEIIYSSEIAPYKSSEKAAAIKHMQHLKPSDLVLYDRNYPSKEFLVLHKKLKLQYCMRTPIHSWLCVREFLASGEKDAIIELKSDRTLRKFIKHYDVDEQPIKLRLLKIDIGGDQPEVLMTSLLDQEKYDYSEFKALYFLRWGVETSFCRLKEASAIEAFSAKSVEGIKQDFYGRILFYSIVGIFQSTPSKEIEESCKGKKAKYKINWQNAISLVKTYKTILFSWGEIDHLVEKVLVLFLQSQCRYRPDRKYERAPKKRKPRSRMTYKTA